MIPKRDLLGVALLILILAGAGCRVVIVEPGAGCVEACAQAAECGLFFPESRLGQDEDQCIEQCSIEGGKSKHKVLDCLMESRSSCRLAEVGRCVGVISCLNRLAYPEILGATASVYLVPGERDSSDQASKLDPNGECPEFWCLECDGDQSESTCNSLNCGTDFFGSTNNCELLGDKSTSLEYGLFRPDGSIAAIDGRDCAKGSVVDDNGGKDPPNSWAMIPGLYTSFVRIRGELSETPPVSQDELDFWNWLQDENFAPGQSYCAEKRLASVIITSDRGIVLFRPVALGEFRSTCVGE